jgi:hypothetical protein
MMAKDTGEKEDEIAPDQDIDFCTLGMFIVGECMLLFPPNQPRESYHRHCAIVRACSFKVQPKESGSVVVNLNICS